MKPGNLILVKADAFQGKRKIIDRWDDKPHEVVYQITTDVPLYTVKDQQENSCVLHHHWLLLIVSEAGIPLCVGVCQVWDRCTSPTPVKPTVVTSAFTYKALYYPVPYSDQHSSKLICQPWMYFLTWNKYQFKLKVNGVWYSVQ